MGDEGSSIETHYDAGVEAYRQATESPLRRHRTWPVTQSLLPPLNGSHVLDAGCGPGVHTVELADEGASVVGIDVSTEMIRHARETYSDRDDISFHAVDLAEGLDRYEDGSFDAVVCQLVLSHIRDLDPVIAEFRRVLAEHGTLVITGHHPFYDYLVVSRREYPEAASSYDMDIDPTVTPSDHPPKYPDTESYEIDWSDGKGTGVTYYRRPLTALTDPILNERMNIMAIREAYPDEEFQHTHPEEFAAMQTRPPELIAISAKPRVR